MVPSSLVFLVYYNSHVIRQRVIKGTKFIAEIKRMSHRDKDHTWKTDKHNKERRVTKIIHTK